MSTISSSTQFFLALSMLKGVGPVTLRKIARGYHLNEIDIEVVASSTPQIAKALLSADAWSNALREAERQIEQACQHQSRIISPCDSDYPKLLSITKDDPFILYIKGALAKNPEKSVAIIGTREPTPHGQIIATRITQFFVEEGWSIVSGLAIGCDGIAHQAALDAGGHTVAVLAHGLHTVAPSRHKKLAENIVEAGGALISEYPFGQDIQKQQYVKRDRTQAGLAQGVVMVQSDIIGGSLHASRAAIDYGRWLAVPYPTGKDLENKELKVQANLVIADAGDAERVALLRCSLKDLSLVKVLRSKEDYFSMLFPRAGGETATSQLDTFDQVDSGRHITHVTPASENKISIEISNPAPNAGMGTDALLTEQIHIFDETKKGDASIPVVSSNTSSQHLAENIKQYRIVLFRVGGNPIRIVGAESLDFKRYKPLESSLEGADVSSLLGARLGYIQGKIDELRIVSNVEGFKSSFLIEDIVSHIKRVIDLLKLSITLNSYSEKRIGFDECEVKCYLRNDNVSSASVIGSGFNVPLERVLDGFLTLPYKSGGAHLIEEVDGGVVYLEDLVEAFNKIVSRTCMAG